MMKPSALNWDSLDWVALDRLRDTFLSGQPGRADYWRSRSDLENYDFTFAQRIAWKWDAVLRELRLRGWSPPSGTLLDWGCGSGIAGRRVIEFFDPTAFKSLRVFDRSPLAMEFAAERARTAYPGLRIETGHPGPRKTANAEDAYSSSGRFSLGRDEGDSTPNRDLSTTGAGAEGRVAKSIGTLVVSHVLNELDEAGGRALREAIDQAWAVLWVEPGTYADSRSLIELRELLRESFLLIAPCTHQAACGLLVPENERHWCHHFAKLPAGIMADSNWVRFGQRAGIDLRSLPYSFLVLERRGLREPVPGRALDGYSRIIGTPRLYKGYANLFSCQKEGVRDLRLQKRDAPELFRALRKGKEIAIWRWTKEPG